MNRTIQLNSMKLPRACIHRRGSKHKQERSSTDRRRNETQVARVGFSTGALLNKSKLPTKVQLDGESQLCLSLPAKASFVSLTDKLTVTGAKTSGTIGSGSCRIRAQKGILRPTMTRLQSISLPTSTCESETFVSAASAGLFLAALPNQ